jgi:predicted nucleic acid-binding protein
LTVYADSSFLVSLYVTDLHSPDSRRRALTAPGLWYTPLHTAEWAHAIAQHIFRGQMNPDEGREVYHQLEEDKRGGLWTEVQMPENAFDLCADLARRYGPKLGVRTLDSLHVACALELKADRFWTFDERQAKLAKAEGLKIT